MRRKPGQWFLLDGDWSQSVAGHIRAGRFGGIARGEYETRRRRQSNGRYHVYVRYVGGEASGIIEERETVADHEAYQGLPYVEKWAIKTAPPHNGLVFYLWHPVKGGSWHDWGSAWARCDLPCPGPAPAVEDLPPGDKEGF